MSRLVGICVSSSRVKVAPVSTLRVSTSGVVLVTVTVSVTLDDGKRHLDVRVLAERDDDVLESHRVENPGIVTASLYRPGGTRRKRKYPFASGRSSAARSLRSASPSLPGCPPSSSVT